MAVSYASADLITGAAAAVRLQPTRKRTVPCCTLIAFVLGQFGLGAGAAKMRYINRIPLALGGQPGGWKALSLAAIAGVEILLASAALPLIATGHGREDAGRSFRHMLHVCSLDVLGTRAPGNN